MTVTRIPKGRKSGRKAREIKHETYGPYRAHPAAEWFPLLEGDEFTALVDSINDEGQQDPIVVCGDVLIDGRNRWKACEALGMKPRVVQREFADNEEAARYVIVHNLRRRHLTLSQRAMIASRAVEYYKALAKMARGARTDLTGPSPSARARDKAAEDMGVSSRTVGAALRVVKQGAPELIDAVERGDVAVTAAAEVARLPTLEQQATVAAGPDAVAVRAAEERERRTAEKEAARAARTSSESEEWYTPEEFVAPYRELVGGITLDPASCEAANVQIKAAVYYTRADDGLTKPWRGHVLLNPPYGRDEDGRHNVPLWIAHAIQQYDDGLVDSVLLVVKASTAKAWFEQLWDFAICWPPRAIPFISGESGAPKAQNPHGHVLVYMGPDNEGFARAYRDVGPVTLPTESAHETRVAAGRVAAVLARVIDGTGADAARLVEVFARLVDTTEAAGPQADRLIELFTAA